MGGEGIAFPSIAIEPLPGTPLAETFDLFIFVSVHAVRHGLARIQKSATSHVAAIGPATAKALAAANMPANVITPAPHNSEALLALPELANVGGQRILIVRGEGGRNLLRDSLLERGASVEYLDVYRRVRAEHLPTATAALEQRWQQEGIGIVTITSVEILDNLLTTLSALGRELLKTTPFVAASERVASAAQAKGLVGTCVQAHAADDDSILGAVARWHARAK